MVAPYSEIENKLLRLYFLPHQGSKSMKTGHSFHMAVDYLPSTVLIRCSTIIYYIRVKSVTFTLSRLSLYLETFSVSRLTGWRTSWWASRRSSRQSQRSWSRHSQRCPATRSLPVLIKNTSGYHPFTVDSEHFRPIPFFRILSPYVGLYRSSL